MFFLFLPLKFFYFLFPIILGELVGFVCVLWGRSEIRWIYAWLRFWWVVVVRGFLDLVVNECVMVNGNGNGNVNAFSYIFSINVESEGSWSFRHLSVASSNKQTNFGKSKSKREKEK